MSVRGNLLRSSRLLTVGSNAAAATSAAFRPALSSPIIIRHSSSIPFRGGPSPPPLPKEDQEIFDKLVRQSTGAFSTPANLRDSLERTRPHINQSPHADAPGPEPEPEPPIVAATGEGEELHPNVFRGAKPEFEGDVNPKTGEVGGPKNEPLRWGSAGDWSYNGRVTDF